MWLLFHCNAKTRLVRDGQTFVETCPQCGRRAKFEEVEHTESYGVFFVDLVDDRERGYRCRECGEVFDLKDEPTPAERLRVTEPAAVEPTPRQRAETARADDVAADRRRAATEAKANQIEDELAELKKRLGR